MTEKREIEDAGIEQPLADQEPVVEKATLADLTPVEEPSGAVLGGASGIGTCGS